MFTYYDYDLESAVECAKNIANTFGRVVYVYQKFGRYLLASKEVSNPIIAIGGAE